MSIRTELKTFFSSRPKGVWLALFASFALFSCSAKPSAPSTLNFTSNSMSSAPVALRSTVRPVIKSQTAGASSGTKSINEFATSKKFQPVVAAATCDPSDPTCTTTTGGGTCDPSDPTCSNGGTTCDPTTDPSCPGYSGGGTTCDPTTDPTCPGYTGPTCDPLTDPTCPGYVAPVIPNPPTVSIVSPYWAETITGSTGITVSAGADTAAGVSVDHVEIDVDSTYVGFFYGSYGTLFVDTRAFTNGYHTIWATVVDSAGASVNTYVNVYIENSGTPVGSISLNGTQVSLSAWDITAPGAAVKVLGYVDGDMNHGNYLGSAYADSTLSFPIPTYLQDGYTHTLWIYAEDANQTGVYQLLAGAPLTFRINPCEGRLGLDLSLHFPIVDYGGSYYWANFQLVPGTTQWTLASVGQVANPAAFSACVHSSLSPTLNGLVLSSPAVSYDGNSSLTYWGNFKFINATSTSAPMIILNQSGTY